MIRLEETYYGEIISLKKGKRGLITIKLKLNNEEDKQNVGIFTRKRRKIANVSSGSSGNFRALEEDKQDHTRTETASQGAERRSESGSESGKIISESENPS